MSISRASFKTGGTDAGTGAGTSTCAAANSALSTATMSAQEPLRSRRQGCRRSPALSFAAAERPSKTSHSSQDQQASKPAGCRRL